MSPLTLQNLYTIEIQDEAQKSRNFIERFNFPQTVLTPKNCSANKKKPGLIFSHTCSLRN